MPSADNNQAVYVYMWTTDSGLFGHAGRLATRILDEN